MIIDRKTAKVEHVGALLAILFLCFSIFAGDYPAIFLCVSFLLFLVADAMQNNACGFGQVIANTMKAFSLSLFVGALVWAFC